MTIRHKTRRASPSRQTVGSGGSPRAALVVGSCIRVATGGVPRKPSLYASEEIYV
jgi:hypothetical protein